MTRVTYHHGRCRKSPTSITVNDNENATTLPPPLLLPQAQQRQLRLRGLKTCATPSIFFLSLSYFLNSFYLRATTYLHHWHMKSSNDSDVVGPRYISLSYFYLFIYCHCVCVRNYINYAHSSSPSDSVALGVELDDIL